jgi:hypothetical protein
MQGKPRRKVMPGVSDASVTTVTLAIGAAGAITAIYLKEAVQAAIQRRVITWQLFAYLISWKSQILKDWHAASVYETVKTREIALSKAAARSTEEFRKMHEQQHADRNELRKQLKELIIDSISKAEIKNWDDPLSKLVTSEASAFAAEKRQLLADSKSFISDRDAAILGKGPAMNVVQFRTSLLVMMSALDGVLKVFSVDSEHRPKLIAGLADHLIVYGEDALVALIRLERNVDQLSKKSVIELTWDILRGS